MFSKNQPLILRAPNIKDILRSDFHVLSFTNSVLNINRRSRYRCSKNVLPLFSDQIQKTSYTDDKFLSKTSMVER